MTEFDPEHVNVVQLRSPDAYTGKAWAESIEDALRQSEERFRILAEAMPQFVWVSDAEGRVEYVNGRWTEYTGQTLEQTGPQDDTIIHPEDAPLMWQRWREAREAGSDYEAEFRCRRLCDGVYRWFLARGVPLKDAQGRIIRWIGTSTDIDAQKQAEAQVTLLNTRLHRAMYESSHRIKNQLQILTATIDLTLLDGDDLIPAEKFRKLGSQIHTLSVLQDLLTLEWKKDPTGDVVNISVRTMLTQVLGTLQQTSREYEIAFEIEELALPLRTATSLALVTNEVVTNAIKYGKDKIDILFSVYDNKCMLAVCDDGPGFPADFNPRTAANTGLELIDALAVHDLHGTVHYANRPQRGAHVVIAFPVPDENALRL